MTKKLWRALLFAHPSTNFPTSHSPPTHCPLPVQNKKRQTKGRAIRFKVASKRGQRTRLRGLCRARATSLRSNNLLPARKNEHPTPNPPSHPTPPTASNPPQTRKTNIHPKPTITLHTTNSLKPPAGKRIFRCYPSRRQRIM
ncbi:MAG: hypothetical protein LBQ31_01810 [Bacteroidales bacterium]|jgi:hypothetical protein|nr:hypothetical protein [Bacteroidales bacterium]